MQKEIIEVVPLTKIPLSRNQSFSYVYNKKIPLGSLVNIPLFKRKVEGIVIQSKPDFLRLGNIELKRISAILEEDFLTENQIELALFLSEYYFSPLGIILKSFVPKRTKERKSKEKNKKIEPPKSIKLTEKQSKSVEELTRSYKLKPKSYLLYGPSGSGKTEVYINSIKKLAEKNKDFQFLILLPELTLTPQAIERYGKHFDREELAVINSSLSKGKLYSAWKKIKSGEAKIIIASRMGIFAPFKNLGLIVIDEEQDISFKQWDMSPRYDARKAAEKISEIHRCKIVFGSATPRIEKYFSAKEGSCELITLPKLKSAPPSEIEIVDLKKERWKNNFSILSKKLQSEISYVLKNNLQAIFFVNRQGMSNFSICENCKTVLKCPKCDRALIYDEKGTYRCVHCRFQTSITPQCSKCSGISFKNVGIGTQKVESEIKKMFSEARIARADNQTMKKSGSHKNLYEDFAAGKYNILIGTQIISKGWDLPRVSLIGIIDADNMLSVPDFSVTERAFQTIIQVSGRTGRPEAKFPGKVVIQTYHPESNFFKMISEMDLENLYAQEISSRKALDLPPFGKLIKLIFQDYSLKKIEAEMKKVAQSLKDKEYDGIAVSDPHDPLVSKIRGRFRKQIILKIKIGKEIPEEISNILKSLPAGWLIDVDPITII